MQEGCAPWLSALLPWGGGCEERMWCGMAAWTSSVLCQLSPVCLSAVGQQWQGRSEVSPKCQVGLPVVLGVLSLCLASTSVSLTGL